MNPSNIHPLLSSTSMTPAERRLGRFMRAPDGHPEGGGSEAPNNTGGNSDPGGGGDTSQNNSGEPPFDPASFWSDPEPEAAPASRSDSPPDSGSQPQGTPPPPPPPQSPFAAEMMSRIEGLPFEDVFNDEVTAAINGGDYKAANEAVKKNLRESVKQGMVTNVQLLRQFAATQEKAIMAKVEALVGQKLTGRDQKSELVKAIPSAANPKVGPAVEAIYERALEKSGGDVPKALAMTKSMLSTLAGETAGDIDLQVAPKDPHSTPPPPVTNWLEELAGNG